MAGEVFLISKRDVRDRPVVTAAKVSLEAAWAAAARDRATPVRKVVAPPKKCGVIQRVKARVRSI